MAASAFLSAVAEREEEAWASVGAAECISMADLLSD